jgi:hypothetical protein
VPNIVDDDESTIIARITAKDVYLKLLDLERELQALKVRVYTVAGVITSAGLIAGIAGGFGIGT